MSDFLVTLSNTPILVSLVSQPLQVVVTISEGGAQGPRGSGFVGAYAAQVNLPTIDEINVKDGDFALTQDGTIWRVE